jgi:hypothetical protein
MLFVFLVTISTLVVSKCQAFLHAVFLGVGQVPFCT